LLALAAAHPATARATICPGCLCPAATRAIPELLARGLLRDMSVEGPLVLVLTPIDLIHGGLCRGPRGSA
jgi:hypothetical protein